MVVPIWILISATEGIDDGVASLFRLHYTPLAESFISRAVFKGGPVISITPFLTNLRHHL